MVSVPALEAWLREVGDVEGITFSGGEPFLQAPAFARLARAAREELGLGVVCFTGYTIEELKMDGPDGAGELLAWVDLLIDGPFIADQSFPDRWRGSRNQRLLALSPRYARLVGEAAVQSSEAELTLGPGFSVATGDLEHSPLNQIAALLSARYGVEL